MRSSAARGLGPFLGEVGVDNELFSESPASGDVPVRSSRVFWRKHDALKVQVSQVFKYFKFRARGKASWTCLMEQREHLTNSVPSTVILHQIGLKWPQ
jgi:hypothetical protein